MTPRRWACAVGALVLLDVWCDRNSKPGDTLSEALRGVLTSPGRRAMFSGALVGGGVWLHHHILDPLRG